MCVPGFSGDVSLLEGNTPILINRGVIHPGSTLRPSGQTRSPGSWHRVPGRRFMGLKQSKPVEEQQVVAATRFLYAPSGGSGGGGIIGTSMVRNSPNGPNRYEMARPSYETARHKVKPTKVRGHISIGATARRKGVGGQAFPHQGKTPPNTVEATGTLNQS